MVRDEASSPRLPGSDSIPRKLSTEFVKGKYEPLSRVAWQ